MAEAAFIAFGGLVFGMLGLALGFAVYRHSMETRQMVRRLDAHVARHYQVLHGLTPNEEAQP